MLALISLLASSLLASGCTLSHFSGPDTLHLSLASSWPGLLPPALKLPLLPTENHYWRLDSSQDGWHSWLIEHLWPQGPSTVDAAFLWDKKLYLIQVCEGEA